ncbi:cupin domain-containing protein [Gemmobacter sp.]|uniref:cupin domain-containing protein n=1 Tax=Gemmobacter sp. TaxID=1898957 RepID=UPI002AFFBB9D|nr:cupin domain-containing protein [Gemmobacter sp.]
MSDDIQKVVLLRPKETTVAVQGMPQFFGISAMSAGSQGLSMNLTAFDPGGSAKPHYHRNFETAVYGVTGRVALYYGPQLEELCVIEPGDFCFIPPGIPHAAYNLSDTESATSVSSRNDPVEQENVIRTPELDGLRDADAAALKARLLATA